MDKQPLQMDFQIKPLETVYQIYGYSNLGLRDGSLCKIKRFRFTRLHQCQRALSSLSLLPMLNLFECPSNGITHHFIREALFLDWVFNYIR